LAQVLYGHGDAQLVVEASRAQVAHLSFGHDEQGAEL